jgi:hypothetical protein
MWENSSKFSWQHEVSGHGSGIENTPYLLVVSLNSALREVVDQDLSQLFRLVAGFNHAHSSRM